MAGALRAGRDRLPSPSAVVEMAAESRGRGVTARVAQVGIKVYMGVPCRKTRTKSKKMPFVLFWHGVYYAENLLRTVAYKHVSTKMQPHVTRHQTARRSNRLLAPVGHSSHAPAARVTLSGSPSLYTCSCFPQGSTRRLRSSRVGLFYSYGKAFCFSWFLPLQTSDTVCTLR